MIRFRPFLRVGLGSSLAAATLFVAGFFIFCATLPRAGDLLTSKVPDVPVDQRGIIILTGGGGERISEGLALFSQGMADRVLISGVHPKTTKHDLSTMGDAATLSCCVDLGSLARSTRGNAAESRAWLNRHGYSAAYLVTSDFHLRRATAELRRVAPQVTVVPVPVASRLVPEKGWMGRLSSWQLLASEYVKYLFVVLRSGL